ncbi:MAG: hypothetical protein Q9185_002350 [Variospora sp. 1 TL-2023]
MVYTPFIQKIATGYGAVEAGILTAIVDFNAAAQEASEATARHNGSCVICHDLLVFPEGGAPQLALCLLPKCKHVFHEPLRIDPHPSSRRILNFKINLSGDALRTMNKDPNKFFQTWDFLKGISLLATAEFKSSEPSAEELKATLPI